MTRIAALLACLALTACGGGEAAVQPAEGPTVVSVNPCSDQLLEALDADDQVMAVSHWSHDPDSASAPYRWARQFPATTGRAEELIQTRPDLVRSGGLMPPQAKAMLERADVEVMDFPVPRTIGESLMQISEMGTAIGRDREAADLTANIETSLAQAALNGGEGRSALVITGSALTGDDTLIGDMLRHMGYRNAAADYGVANLADLRMERLIADPPDVIFAMPDSRLFDHPALDRLSRHVDIRKFPTRLSWCAGPTMVAMARAMERRQ